MARTLGSGEMGLEHAGPEGEEQALHARTAVPGSGPAIQHAGSACGGRRAGATVVSGSTTGLETSEKMGRGEMSRMSGPATGFGW
jgi:hypothetical protein